MQTTLNQLKLELKAIQEGHGQLNSFFWGSFDRSQFGDAIQYPLMCCYDLPAAGDFKERLTGTNLVVMVADRVLKGEANLDDTYSDAKEVCRHIFNVIKKSKRWRKIVTVRSASANKFREKGADEVAGYFMQMTLDLKASQSICDLPFFDYDFDTLLSDQETEILLNGDEFLSLKLGDNQNILLVDQFGNEITPSNITGTTIEITI